jgi:hypothetical protein
MGTVGKPHVNCRLVNQIVVGNRVEQDTGNRRWQLCVWRHMYKKKSVQTDVIEWRVAGVKTMGNKGIEVRVGRLRQV